MNFDELVIKRQSCRAYKDVPVEREKLIACVQAARMSPSACNSQPWSFIIVDDIETAKAVSGCLTDKILTINRFTEKCNAYIVIVEESANLSAKLGAKFKDQEYAQIDIGIAAQSLCLAATDQGLGNCIIGWFSEKKIKELLKIPKSRRVRLIIAIGYAQDERTREKARKPFEETVHYNEW